MLLRIVLVFLGCWALPTSALQCHNIKLAANGVMTSTSRTCAGNQICGIYMQFNNTFDKIEYDHDCFGFCSKNEWAKLRMNVIGDSDQTCTYYIQNGIKKLYCECSSNFCNDLGSPLQKLLRNMYEALSDRDLHQVLKIGGIPKGDMAAANPSSEIQPDAPTSVEGNHTRSKRAAVTLLNCQKVARKGDAMEISFETGVACGIIFQTTGDMKTVATFTHQSFSYCIYKALIKKVYRLDGDPSQTCIHYVQDNRESVYCECYTSNCNSINSPLHNLFKSVVKEALGRDISYYVNYPRLACDSANLSMVRQWPY